MQDTTILLVEDDFLNRRLTKKVLLEKNYHVLEAKNINEAINILQQNKIQLAILDINLGENEQDGTTLGQMLFDKYHIPFVYLTAYDSAEVVKKAIKTAPHAYVTKPFKNIDLVTSIELAIRQFPYQAQNLPSIVVKDGDYNLELLLSDINYIMSEGNYLLFYTDNKIYKHRFTIKQILEILPESLFIQTHRAFVVNKSKVIKFNMKNIIINEAAIPVSSNYIKDVNIFRR